MPFVQKKLVKSVEQTRGIFDKYIYAPDNNDTLVKIKSDNYFELSRFADDPDWVGSYIEIHAVDGYGLLRVLDGSKTVAIIETQEPLTAANNIVNINSEEQLPNQTETTWQPEDDTLYHFGSLVITDKQCILGSNITFRGINNKAEVYRYTGVGTAFVTGTPQRGIFFDWFCFSCPNGEVWDLEFPSPLVFNFSRCLNCESVGPINNGSINFFAGGFENVKTQGLILTGSFFIGAFRENFWITGDTGVRLIDFDDAVFITFEIANLEMQAPAGSFCLYSTKTDGSNMQPGRVGSIQNSNLSTKALGNSIGGGLQAGDPAFDFINSTVPDSKLIGHCYIDSGDEEITPITAGVEVQIEGVFTQGSKTSQATTDALGNITTLNRIEKSGLINVDLDVTKSGGVGGVDDYIFRIKKIPISTGVPETIDGAFKTAEITGGASAPVSMTETVNHIDGDIFFVTVEGVGTNDDLTIVTDGFKVIG